MSSVQQTLDLAVGGYAIVLDGELRGELVQLSARQGDQFDVLSVSDSRIGDQLPGRMLLPCDQSGVACEQAVRLHRRSLNERLRSVKADQASFEAIVEAAYRRTLPTLF